MCTGVIEIRYLKISLSLTYRKDMITVNQLQPSEMFFFVYSFGQFILISFH